MGRIHTIVIPRYTSEDFSHNHLVCYRGLGLRKKAALFPGISLLHPYASWNSGLPWQLLPLHSGMGEVVLSSPWTCPFIHNRAIFKPPRPVTRPVGGRCLALFKNVIEWVSIHLHLCIRTTLQPFCLAVCVCSLGIEPLTLAFLTQLLVADGELIESHYLWLCLLQYKATA